MGECSASTNRAVVGKSSPVCQEGGPPETLLDYSDSLVKSVMTGHRECMSPQEHKCSGLRWDFYTGSWTTCQRRLASLGIFDHLFHILPG